MTVSQAKKIESRYVNDVRRTQGRWGQELEMMLVEVSFTFIEIAIIKASEWFIITAHLILHTQWW